MEKGFNSNVLVSGETLHVQTEDWGTENPYIVSRVYRHGAVVGSFKTPYTQVVSQGPEPLQQAIRSAVRHQHQEILDQLSSGHLVL